MQAFLLLRCILDAAKIRKAKRRRRLKEDGKEEGNHKLFCTTDNSGKNKRGKGRLTKERSLRHKDNKRK